MVSRADLYRQKATEYADKAQWLTDPEAKRLNQQLAERWRLLAAEVEFIDQLKP